MPFFIFNVSQSQQLTYVDTKEKYKEARALVRQRRQERSATDEHEVRMVFANNRAEAEKLLSTPRDERVIGED